jgi:hypothetical protein
VPKGVAIGGRFMLDMPIQQRLELQQIRRTNIQRIKREWKERNRDQTLAANRREYAEDPWKARLARIRQRFGLSPSQYLALIYFQDHRCACCGTSDPGSVHGWHVDHDHTTGKVRGAVCHRCNTVLGMLGDHYDAAVLRTTTFLTYLESHT